MVISLKRLLERRPEASVPDHNPSDTPMEMVRLLLDSMATHAVRGDETEHRILRSTLHGLIRQLDAPHSAIALMGIASDAAEAQELYSQRTTEHLRKRHEEWRSIVSMLTDTVAEVSGQTDASVERLQAIEKQLVVASESSDIGALRTTLGDTLQALREAVAHQRSSAVETVERLRSQIATAKQSTRDDPASSPGALADTESPPEAADGAGASLPTSYVAAFRLQRAEFIANRFGESATHKMLTLLSTQLKTVLSPNDRLLRWKGMSYVMFIHSNSPIQQVRARLTEVVAVTGQQYIEVGPKSALLSVGVDWVVFPQANRPLDALFAEVDAFLANPAQGAAPVMVRR